MNVAKTLFVTDLDGTLLKNDRTISENTKNIINQLIDEGMHITYATARAFNSSGKITKDIHFNLPVITRNGAVLADQGKQVETEILKFNKAEVEQLKKILSGRIENCGFVTTYSENQMSKRYKPNQLCVGMQHYMEDHKDDNKMHALLGDEDIFDGLVTYITLIDTKENLQPIFDVISQYDTWESVLQEDVYWKDYWLEICPKGTTKAKAILKCMKNCNCESVVVFGDSVNDLSMFEVADEAYAVANALPEVKDKATKIIDSNENDGVAKFLMDAWLGKK